MVIFCIKFCCSQGINRKFVNINNLKFNNIKIKLTIFKQKN